MNEEQTGCHGKNFTFIAEEIETQQLYFRYLQF